MRPLNVTRSTLSSKSASWGVPVIMTMTTDEEGDLHYSFLEFEAFPRESRTTVTSKGSRKFSNVQGYTDRIYTRWKWDIERFGQTRLDQEEDRAPFGLNQNRRVLQKSF